MAYIPFLGNSQFSIVLITSCVSYPSMTALGDITRASICNVFVRGSSSSNGVNAGKSGLILDGLVGRYW